MYVIQTKDPIAKEVLTLFNAKDWLDFTHTKKGEALKAKIHYCDKDQHGKAYVVLNEFLIDCNGADKPFCVKDFEENNNSGWYMKKGTMKLIDHSIFGVTFF